MTKPVINAATADAPVTVVTQTRVRDGMAEDFARWQSQISAAVAASPGFLTQSVLPPNPPLQTDWVIQQRFASVEAASAWLRSERRTALLTIAQPMLVGPDDVHLVRDEQAGVRPAPVSIVISSRIRPGQEAAFRAWEHRIAAAQAKSPGFQGYRFEPPIPGVQDDWLAILRFDSEQNLQIWLDSPARKKLLEEATPFLDEFHTRVVHTGFEQWFRSADSRPPPPAWKQNMIVLLLLYPVVFLFGAWVQTPLLMGRAALPFWLALFIGNIVSVLLLNWLVPWVSSGFGWWLSPATDRGARRTSIAGAALVVLLYAACLLVFSRLA